MGQRLTKEVLIATSAKTVKKQKRARNHKPEIVNEQNNRITPSDKQTVTKNKRENVNNKRPILSKKTLKQLLERKIDYRPFNLLKETTGEEGNYRKLIYNTPKY